MEKNDEQKQAPSLFKYISRWILFCLTSTLLIIHFIYGMGVTLSVFLFCSIAILVGSAIGWCHYKDIEQRCIAEEE
jgi:DMSO reductase anchor subunit